MKVLLKYKSEIILSLVIAAFYFFLRLIFISDLPIFTDEAIYARWAQIALHDSSWRFISLTDGKQPMFIWFGILFMKIFQDPLLSLRLVSVMAGFFTMVGLFFLTYELFKSKTMSFITTILYVFYPFAQVYDRIALYDSMVATFSVWALYLSIHLVKKVRLDIAYSLGFVIGAGILTKTSNFFSIYLLPFTLLLFDFKKKPVLKRFVTFVALALFSSAVAYGLYNILRLSPLFQMISAKNAIFVYPLSEWIQHPLTFFVGNLNGLFSWLTQYLTLPYIVLILISLILIRKNFKEKALLILYFLLPFTALALFGRVIFPRFIFFMSLYLLPLASWGLNFLINRSMNLTKIDYKFGKIKSVVVIATFVFIWYPGFISYQFAKSPITSKIAKADNSQYINSWAAGWGVKESVKFFEDQASKGKIYIATEGTFGLLPAALEMYLVDNKNVTIKGYWPVNDVTEEVLDAASIMPTYYVFYQKEHVEIPSSYPLKLLFKVRQGNTDFYYRVYQVIPK
jgi:4-amino-4-deoxy-L-arabinose transferase-like glycosyltransferase